MQYKIVDLRRDDQWPLRRPLNPTILNLFMNHNIENHTWAIDLCNFGWQFQGGQKKDSNTYEGLMDIS